MRHAPGLLWVGGFPVPVEFETDGLVDHGDHGGHQAPGHHDGDLFRALRRAAYRALEDVAQSFLITREGLNARADSYRSVRDMLLERKFQWPARMVPAPVPFLRPSPAKESPRVTAASR